MVPTPSPQTMQDNEFLPRVVLPSHGGHVGSCILFRAVRISLALGPTFPFSHSVHLCVENDGAYPRRHGAAQVVSS